MVLNNMTSTTEDMDVASSSPDLSSHPDPSSHTDAPSDAMPALLNLEEVQLIMQELAESGTHQPSPHQATSSPNHAHYSPNHSQSSPAHPDASPREAELPLTTDHHSPRSNHHSPTPTHSSPQHSSSSPIHKSRSPPCAKSPSVDENNNGECEEDGPDKVDLGQLKVEIDKAKSGGKPGLSYIALISLAVTSVPDQRMVLGDIYSWVAGNFPYFRLQDRSWRNSIRHNLSLNECFIKAGRSENGKGNYWAIHPANVDDFRRGDFRRRRARRQVRKCNARLEEQSGRPESARPGHHGNGQRAQRPSHQDATSYVTMTSTALTDAEIVAMFGANVLRTTRDPSTAEDTCSIEGATSPTPASDVTRDAVTSHPYTVLPSGHPQRPSGTETRHNYPDSHYTYPADQSTGFVSQQFQPPSNHYEPYYGQGAPLSSCRWQHQAQTPGGSSVGYMYQSYESNSQQHMTIL